MIPELRDDLEAIRSLLEAGETAAATRKLDAALQGLEAHRLLTTSEAAEVLGIRSVNTLKALVRAEGIQTVMHGNRMMIPLVEVERLRGSERVRGIRAADRAHDAAEALGTPEGLSQEEMDSLSASRPGTPPWQRTMRSPSSS
jgi:excisionase family DNA binding protein